MKNLMKCIFIFALAFGSAHAQNNYSFSVYLKDQMIEVSVDGLLLKTIPCSTGIKPGSTPTGRFKTYSKKEKGIWVEQDGTQIMYYYITKFNGDISFHSLIEGNHAFVEEGKKRYEARKPSSMGCIRLQKEDARWIYDLPLEMAVEIIDDFSPIQNQNLYI
jgi:lipoprotein-anchoring transpeptidase ErfK/SrfK